MFTKIEIDGLRGFSSLQELNLAVPNDRPGSGLTVIVGANNTGKTTIVEAFRAFVSGQHISFIQGRRNRRAGDRVLLRITDEAGKSAEIQSIHPGSSQIRQTNQIQNQELSRLFVVPARRSFGPFFSRTEAERQGYMASFVGWPDRRTAVLDGFSSRLFLAVRNKTAFNTVLERVLNRVPDWTIDQDDHGDYFLKFLVQDSSHNTEGLGEGLISLLFVIDALYDSEPGDTIVIDEPELSLHPALQRKLASLMADYARGRQIVLSTHSPFFIPLESLNNGAIIARTHLGDDGGVLISQLSIESAKWINSQLGNLNSPHTLGLSAKEVFFLDDKVVLVEGQEDVVFYPRVLQQLGKELDASFFGWGVGGAGNMRAVAKVLDELGFGKVVGILDGDKKERIQELETEFPDYRFFSIPAQDVRTKAAREARERVVGLLDDENVSIRPEYLEQTKSLFEKIGQYFE